MLINDVTYFHMFCLAMAVLSIVRYCMSCTYLIISEILS